VVGGTSLARIESERNPDRIQQSAGSWRPAQPGRSPATPAEAAPQVSPGPCSRLTKQTLADGSVLFADICTQQSAIAPPQAMSASRWAGASQ
jgi:hypothetical protein